MRKREAFVIVAAGLIALAGCGNKTDTSSTPPAASPGVTPPGGPPGGPPGAALAGNATSGKAIFASNCAGCHGADGGGRRPGMPKFNTAAWQTEMKDDAQVLAVVKNGKGKMPAFGGRLTDQQQHDAVAFIRTLAPAK